MKAKNEILNELKNNGFSILEGYYNQDFCESAKKEIMDPAPVGSMTPTDFPLPADCFSADPSAKLARTSSS